MQIEVQEPAPGVTKIVLSGRIDITGAMAIDGSMTSIARTCRALIIDLSGVEFMASMGLRSLVKCGKAIRGKQGRVVLLSPRHVVAEVIHASGIDDLIPVCLSEAAALEAVTPP